MEEQQQKTKTNKIIPIAVTGIIILAVVGFFGYSSLRPNSNSAESPEMVTSTPIPTITATEQSNNPQYKDGSYTASGDYISPGGPRQIDVTLVIKDRIVTDSVFIGKATDPASKRFQSEFADNYKVLVVGKNINELNLTKVSGSSLTPKGFNDALEKIKAEAQNG